jgi:hypothetical protein
MKIFLAVLGALALANAAPTDVVVASEKRTSITDIFGSSQKAGPYLDLLGDVVNAIKDLTGVAKKPIASANSFKDWKTFKANGVNLGGWLRTYT